tara:strand:+ start:3124 stop:4044 length:921 start_codon:yes stop_codon:yes gene_type:complete
MKKILPFIFTICIAQDSYNGLINFNYAGTVDGIITSLVQDTVPTGFAFNQFGPDTSYFIMGSITEQENNSFDLFISILQDTTFPVQPRTWEIPGQGNQENPLSLESIVILMPGMDSLFVNEIFDYLSDSTIFGDSVNFDSLLTNVFVELADNLYLGLAGEIEIFDVSDSSLSGNFSSTLIKPAFYFPPHMIMVNNGVFNFNQINALDLTVDDFGIIPESITLFPAYPNPFNPVTTLRFTIAEKSVSHINLDIYDLKGKIIQSLANRIKQPGNYEIQWNAIDFPSGIYIAKLQSGKIAQTTKLLLIK